MATGGGAAFIRLREPDNAIGQAAQHWGGIAAQRNNAREARRAQVQETKRKEKRADAKKQEEKLIKIEDGLGMWDTKSTSLNDLNQNNLARAKDRLGNISVELQNETDPIKIRELNREAENLGKLPEMLHSFSDSITKDVQAYEAGVADGTILEDPSYRARMNALVSDSADVDMTLDRNGMPVLAFKDADGDGIPEYMSYSDYVGGKGKPRAYQSFNLANEVAADAKNYEVQEQVTDENFVKTTDRSVNEDSLKTFVAGKILTAEGGLTDFGRSYAIKNMKMDWDDIDDVDPKDADMLVDSYTDMILATKNLKNDREVDDKGRNKSAQGWSKLKETKRNNKAKGKGKKYENPTSIEATPVTDNTGKIIDQDKSPAPENEGELMTGSNALKFTKPYQTENASGETIKVVGAELGKDGKYNLVVEEEITDKKGGNYSSRRKITDWDEIGEITKQMPKKDGETFEDNEDFGNLLKASLNKKVESNKAKGKAPKTNKKSISNF